MRHHPSFLVSPTQTSVLDSRLPIVQKTGQILVQRRKRINLYCVPKKYGLLSTSHTQNLESKFAKRIDANLKKMRQ